MPFDQTLNSSDVELSPQPQRFGHAGQASIHAIIDSAMEDRLSSKKEVRGLQYTLGRPHTQYETSLWMRRLQTYRTETLGNDLTIAPSGEQIERFLTSIISKVKPKSKHGVPSYSWMRAGLCYLVPALIFHYSNFELSPHDSKRINTLVDSFVKQGRLTKQPARERNTVGVSLVKTMADAMLKHALENGTLNWDVTVQDILHLILLSSLECRTHDITKSRLDDQPLPYLTYGDIALKFVDQTNNIDHLEALVTIRNEKGFKDNPKRNRLTTIHALVDPVHNNYCLVKLILALGLRVGNVVGISIEDVLNKAASRPDRTIMWINPEQPVLASLTTKATHLIPHKRIGHSGSARVVAKAGKLAGIIGQVRSHDLRIGGAFDVAHLKEKPTGHATRAVAHSLGHSMGALMKGITDHYVGSTTYDHWSNRIKESPATPTFGLQIAEAPYVQPKLSSTQITELCLQQSLDSSNKHEREKASKAYRQDHYEKWMTRSKGYGESAPASTLSTKRRRDECDDETQIDLSEEPSPDDIPIDPVLLAEGNHLVNIITGFGEDTTLTEGAEDAIFERIVDPDASATLQTSALSPLEYVKFLSTINIVRNTSIASLGSSKRPAALLAYSGNSRDTPSLFEMPCKNVQYGCDFTTPDSANLNDHNVRCAYTSPRKVPRKEEMFLCDICPAKYDTEKSLKDHIGRKHDWQPRTCTNPRGTCDPNYIFQTESEYAKHCFDFHAQKRLFKPTRCPVPQCLSQKVYEVHDTLRSHLIRNHKLNAKESRQYLPSLRKPRFAQRCPVQGCFSSSVWPSLTSLRKHLATHKLPTDELDQYMSAAKNADLASSGVA